MRRLLVAIPLLLPLTFHATAISQALPPHVKTTNEYSATPTNGFTIDICSFDQVGNFTVSGRVGPDALIGQPVVLSSLVFSLTRPGGKARHNLLYTGAE